MSAGLYIHIPFCTSKCAYCDFVSFSCTAQKQKEYIEALKNEIRQTQNDLVIDTVFIGGGTPSVLYHGGLTEIFNGIKKRFKLDIEEFTVEANPETADNDFIKECAGIGVNRISLGVQTCNDTLLKSLRKHTFRDFIDAVKNVRNEGITNINADLMLGLPDQTLDDVTDSVKKIMDLGLEHVSVYALKVEKGTPLYNSCYNPDDDLSASFYDEAVNLLKSKYIRYEVSNFCLKGYECKHNLKYWTMQPYMGLGLNASSYFNGERIKNTAALNDYLNGKFIESKENVSKDFVLEYIMLSLRTNQGINLDLLKEYNADLLKNPKVSEYLAQKILILDKNCLVLNENYFYLMNSIIVNLI